MTRGLPRSSRRGTAAPHAGAGAVACRPALAAVSSSRRRAPQIAHPGSDPPLSQTGRTLRPVRREPCAVDRQGHPVQIRRLPGRPSGQAAGAGSARRTGRGPGSNGAESNEPASDLVLFEFRAPDESPPSCSPQLPVTVQQRPHETQSLPLTPLPGGWGHVRERRAYRAVSAARQED